MSISLLALSERRAKGSYQYRIALGIAWVRSVTLLMLSATGGKVEEREKGGRKPASIRRELRHMDLMFFRHLHIQNEMGETVPIREAASAVEIRLHKHGGCSFYLRCFSNFTLSSISVGPYCPFCPFIFSLQTHDILRPGSNSIRDLGERDEDTLRQPCHPSPCIERGPDCERR
jgi:hypothetical protein